MNITKLFAEKQEDPFQAKTPTIAFLGDSVTQGCFDVFLKNDGNVETYFDKEHAYHHYVDRIFSLLYPSVPVNIINAGISGDNAPHGAERLARDVLRFSPDLTVVCFGLNDCSRGLEHLEEYRNALKSIFTGLQNSGSEVILMTPNMMATEVSCHLQNETLRRIAAGISEVQNQGILDRYLDAAVQLAEDMNIRVCDVYAKWKRMAAAGVQTTELLENKINHPTKEMNWLFAYSLVETMLS